MSLDAVVQSAADLSTAPSKASQGPQSAPFKRVGWKTRVLAGVAAVGLSSAALAPKAAAWGPDAVGVQVYAIDERGNPIAGDAVELAPAVPVNPADYKTFAMTNASGLDSLYLPPGQALTWRAGKPGYLGIERTGVVADGTWQRLECIQPAQYNPLHNIITLSDVAELKEASIGGSPIDNSTHLESWENVGKIYVQFEGTWTAAEKDSVASFLGIGNRPVDRSRSLAAGLEADNNPGWSGMYWEVPSAVNGIKIRKGSSFTHSPGTRYTTNGRRYVIDGIVTLQTPVTTRDPPPYGKEFWQVLGWVNVGYTPSCLYQSPSDPTPRDNRFTSIIYNVRRRLREADVDVSGVPTLCNRMLDWKVHLPISVQPRSWSQIKDLYRR